MEINKEKKIQPDIGPREKDLKDSKTESLPTPERETTKDSNVALQTEQSQPTEQEKQIIANQRPIKVKDKSVRLQKIEDILSDGVDLIYHKLPDDLKKEFKDQGEQTASKIEEIISKTKIAVYKIIGLIKKWLMIIPNVNKFFLEQDTKIKTEKILDLANKNKKE